MRSAIQATDSTCKGCSAKASATNPLGQTALGKTGRGQPDHQQEQQQRAQRVQPEINGVSRPWIPAEQLAIEHLERSP